MSAEALERAKIEFQAGKAAFERGEYGRSVRCLEQASNLANAQSKLGGEVQIWLVTAYDAAGQRNEAIALCKQLGQHPDLTTRKQSRRMLYIMEAPKLKTRPEWLTQIPDLASLDGNASPSKYTAPPSQPKREKPQRRQFEPELVDLSQIDQRDNRFTWVALVLALLIVAGLIWFGGMSG